MSIDHAHDLHGVPNFASPATIDTIVGATETDVVHLGSTTNVVIDVPLTVYAMGVHGVLTIKSTLRVKELLVFPNGTLICEPGCKIIIRNIPLDLTKDPAQWGNGVICFGKLRMNGTARMSKVRLTKSVDATDTVLNISLPTDWQIGDRVAVPDTRQIGRLTKGYVNQSETFTITAVNDTTLTLNRPATYSHKAAINASGQEELFPHVVNLTRDVVVESEDPNGTRGHFLMMGSGDVILRNAAFKNLGRTTTAPINNSVIDASGTVTHVGTNQIGRYSGPHFHHFYGPLPDPARPYQFEATGCVVDGDDITRNIKWGLVVHQSHYGLIKDNVVYNIAGAGLVTEDGNEFGNLFENNIVVKVTGGPKTDPADQTGSTGDAIWLRGPFNKIVNNVCADVKRMGITWLNLEHTGNVPANLLRTSAKVPSAPGQEPSQYITVPLVWRSDVSAIIGNEVYGTGSDSVNVWKCIRSSEPILIQNHTIWNSVGGGTNVYFGPGDMILDGWLHLNDPTQMTAGEYRHNDGDNKSIGFGGGQAGNLYVRNARVENCNCGIFMRARGEENARDLFDIRDSSFRNACNIELVSFGSPEATVATNCTFGDPVNREALDVFMRWLGIVDNAWSHARPMTLINYNLTGENLDCFFVEQAADYVLPVHPAIPVLLQGKTNAEAFALTGQCVNGQVATCTETRPRFRGFVCLRSN